MIVVGIAFVIPILLHRLKWHAMPVVVAEIIAGLIIGKSGLDLVAEDPWLNLLSLLGFIYLMFLSGVEIDFSSFRPRSGKQAAGPNPVFLSAVLFAVILLLSYVMSLGLVRLGFVGEPYLMTLIIATISLGVVMPVLKEKKLTESGLGQTLLLVTVISDFVTMILLAVYISVRSNDLVQMMLLFVFFALVFVTYRFARRFFNRGLFAMLGKGTVQLGTRAVFALILLFVVLSESLGIENILGAFLAGVIVSLLMPNKEFAHQLDTFGYGFLIPIFFVMVGVNLDLWNLFTEPKVFLLIPLLLCMIFVSKMLPALLLKIWYPWPKVIGSGLLLSSTLSLVIAASTIALELGIIEEQMHGALILVAILSCLLFPMLFSKVFPKETESKAKVTFVGVNHVTVPVAQELHQSGYEVQMFTSQKQGEEAEAARLSRAGKEGIGEMKAAELEPKSLERLGAFAADVVVFGSMDDDANMRLAEYASSRGVKRIIARIEDPGKQEQVGQADGIALFSTLYASRILLKALVEYPGAVQLLSSPGDTIQEIRMDNPAYQGSLLRELPFAGSVLILRIYRGDSFIIPHGNTPLQLGDRLLASGDADRMHELKRLLE
jgi:Kef-type K+ transport system membrane component KefB/Trk K+ transport system NAD-binding subunit